MASARDHPWDNLIGGPVRAADASESLRRRPLIAAVVLRFAVRYFQDARSGEQFVEGSPS
ncbi:hypothetical protein [Streptomyces sp. NPDC088755]|uniref:hypothetical protein n=1 Tax=Streptomyces sp. NPDC088755 TaxID=3365888 RepID=UPI00381CCB13